MIKMMTTMTMMIDKLGSSLCLSVDSAKLRSVDCCFFAKPANVNLDFFSLMFVCLHHILPLSLNACSFSFVFTFFVWIFASRFLIPEPSH